MYRQATLAITPQSQVGKGNATMEDMQVTLGDANREVHLLL